MASSTNDGEPQSDDDPFADVDSLFGSDDSEDDSSARQPQVGEGWVQDNDQKYCIVVRIAEGDVWLVTKDNWGVVSLNRFANSFSYKDEGVKIGQKWSLKSRENVLFRITSVPRFRREDSYYFMTGLLILNNGKTYKNINLYKILRDFKRVEPDNSGAGSSGAASSSATSTRQPATAVQNDGSGGGGEGATSRPNVPVDVIDLTNEGTSSNVNSQRKRKRQKKEEKEKKEARNNRIKSDQVCPICQESLNNNLDNPNEEIVIAGGKVLIGDQRVKILKCCGNAIHYTCFLRYVEANKDKSKVKCPFNDELGKVPKNGVKNFVDKWLRDPNSIVRKEIPAHIKIVYRLSCQLKF